MTSAGAPWTTGQLAGRFGIEASAEASIRFLALPERAAPGALVLARTSEEAARAEQAGAAAVLCSAQLITTLPRLIADDPQAAYAGMCRELTPFPGAVVSPEAQWEEGVEVGPGSVIEAGARLGEAARIGACCYVAGDVVVGPECRLEPGCLLLDGTRLGRGVTVGPASVLGSDGYGYVLDQGRHLKVPQVGQVEVGDRAVIGAGCCIDRATTAITRLGADVRLGALSQVGHNVQIGDRTRIGPQAGLAGSSVIGEDCELGFQTGASGHSHLGARSRLADRSGLTRRSSPPDSDLAGFPARPRGETVELQAALQRLPEALEELKRRL